MNKPIAVLVSGGVDSAVALALLKEQGYQVQAYYLKIWLEDELSYLGECPWEEDLMHVKNVCSHLNVPLEILSLQQAYWQNVVSYTISNIKKGYTPNPDMLCNKAVKFGAFYDLIKDHHELIATGHYAQVITKNNQKYLSMGPDSIKDQTYFLAQISQEQLQRAMFPIGHLTKHEVRQKAIALRLPNAERKDSQGICFLGKIPFPEFVKYHLGISKGKLVEYETGKVMGEHDGFWFYTIGQRKGIGLSHGPWYVVSKDIIQNIIFISNKYHDEEKIRKEVTITNLNWLAQEILLNKIKVKLRHGPSIHQACVVRQYQTAITFCLEQNDQGIAAGQFAVIYSEENICLVSGMIDF